MLTIGPPSAIRPTVAGTVINVTSLIAKDNDSLKPGQSSFTAYSDIEGSTAVATAITKTPIGSSTILSA